VRTRSGSKTLNSMKKMLKPSALSSAAPLPSGSLNFEKQLQIPLGPKTARENSILRSVSSKSRMSVKAISPSGKCRPVLLEDLGQGPASIEELK